MGQNLKLITLTGEFTRPSNTTAYSNGKIVSDSTSAGTRLTLTPKNPDGSSSIGLVAGASYMVKSVELCKSTSGVTNASFDVYLYSSGVTAMNDNSNFTMDFGERQESIGKTSITMYTGDTNSSSAEGVNVDVDHVFIATGTGIDARIVATAAYSPGSAEKFYLKVTIINMD